MNKRFRASASKTLYQFRAAIIIICCSVLLVAPAEAQFINQTSKNDEHQVTLVFGTTNAKHTLLFRRAEHILTYAFNQLGYDFRLLNLPNKRALIWSNEEKLDGVAFRIKTLDSNIYANLVRVDEALFVLDQSVFSRKKIVVNGWQSMENLTVAYEQGTQFIEDNRHHFKQLIPTISAEKAFEHVFDGVADITITSEATGELLLSNYRTRFNDEISVQKPALVELSLFSFMHKKHEALAKELQQVLRQMKLDGRYQRLIAEIQ